MGIIVSEEKNCFDTDIICRGTIIRAKHSSWDKALLGFVTHSSDNEVVVQFPPETGNVTNHFFVYADEVAEGSWEIKASKDLETFYSVSDLSGGGSDEP